MRRWDSFLGRERPCAETLRVVDHVTHMALAACCLTPSAHVLVSRYVCMSHWPAKPAHCRVGVKERTAAIAESGAAAALLAARLKAAEALAAAREDALCALTRCDPPTRPA